jgi:hypothetical protein
MALYAIETESHNDKTITHFTPWGKQLEGHSGRWQGMCGRYVRGTVWEHGTIDGPRCINCVKKQLQRQGGE